MFVTKKYHETIVECLERDIERVKLAYQQANTTKLEIEASVYEDRDVLRIKYKALRMENERIIQWIERIKDEGWKARAESEKTKEENERLKKANAELVAELTSMKVKYECAGGQDETTEYHGVTSHRHVMDAQKEMNKSTIELVDKVRREVKASQETMEKNRNQDAAFIDDMSVWVDEVEEKSARGRVESMMDVQRKFDAELGDAIKGEGLYPYRDVKLGGKVEGETSLIGEEKSEMQHLMERTLKDNEDGTFSLNRPASYKGKGKD